MNKLIITILILLLLTIMVLVPVSINGFVVSSGENLETQYDYIWTTAICEGSDCADYEVTCKNGEVVSQRRVTGFIALGNDWEDPRDSTDLC